MRHVPVLLNEVIDMLALEPGMTVVDCTLGDAGHSEAIVKQIGKTGRLIGIDADVAALVRAKEFLSGYQTNIELVRDNFSHLNNIIIQKKLEEKIDRILIDFGWSTPQFEERGRGFSFQKKDEWLDMRYDADAVTEEEKQTAAGLLNTEDVQKIEEIFNVYGEEKLSKEIAQAIGEYRKEQPIQTVGDLVEIVLACYRKKLHTTKEVPWIGGMHPATKVFQALRIAVNDELGVIESVLPQAIDVLKPGGRLAIISFHSLEDRIVKHYFKSVAAKKQVNILTKKPIVCSDEEAKQNPPSRSAKLRVIEKL